MNHRWTTEPQSDDEQAMLDAATYALSQADKCGASMVECTAGHGQGFSVTVRQGEIEAIEHSRDKALSITLYFNHNKASASSTDFSMPAIKKTVKSAHSIAGHTEADPYNGLADIELLATKFPALDLDHPWPISLEQAGDDGKACEQAAFDYNNHITNCEGACVTSHRGTSLYANSNAFLGFARTSQHSYGCSVIAGTDDKMQRNYWYDLDPNPLKLSSPQSVGAESACRTVRRLGARKIKTGEYPTIYEAQVASSLLSHFVASISGDSLYRKASFLLDHLEMPVFPSFVSIHEQPHIIGAIGSCVFDNEGVATKPRTIISNGVLKEYILNSYAARKLGLTTTANAGGVHNLIIEPGQYDLAGLIKHMGRGLLITELIGFGVNTVTGDYSRGAFGFWIDHGEIQYPVQEFTVAGNLKKMFAQMVAVGHDIDLRKNIRTGSILIDKLSIAGEV